MGRIVAVVAAVLTGPPISTLQELRQAGSQLASTYKTAWLLKGGHLPGEDSVDLLFHSRGKISEFHSRRIHGVSTHGTGCTTSAAIAASLAQGLPLEAAVSRAKQYVTAAIKKHHRWGETHALNHTA